MKHLWIIIAVLILAVLACGLLETGEGVGPAPQEVTQAPSAVATTVPVSEEEVSHPNRIAYSRGCCPGNISGCHPCHWTGPDLDGRV